MSELIIAVVAYLAVISIVAVAVTIRDKRIAVSNGKLEEKNSQKSSKAKNAKNTSKGKKSGSKSKKNKKNANPQPQMRVPEKTLLIIAALGGAIAMLITMRTIRHKTQHMKFMIGIPAIIVAQCVLVVALVVLL